MAKTSEAMLKAIKKYDDANMAYQSVKVKKSLLEAFKATCKANGDRVNTVLREYIEEYVRKGGRG